MEKYFLVKHISGGSWEKRESGKQVEEWISEIRKLAKIAETDPRLAYAELIHGLRYT